MQKLKKNNKGFTLVELIVVIAILGVLMAVLVPQYIQYVEKSRVAADENAVSEVIHAVQVSLADETVYNAITATTTVTVSNGALGGNTTLTGAIAPIVSAPALKSNTYKSRTYTIDITVTNGVPSVTPYTASKWSAAT